MSPPPQNLSRIHVFFPDLFLKRLWEVNTVQSHLLPSDSNFSLFPSNWKSITSVRGAEHKQGCRSQSATESESKCLEKHSEWYEWKNRTEQGLKEPSWGSLEASLFSWSHVGYQVDMKTLSILAMRHNGADGSQETWNLIPVLLLPSSLKFFPTFWGKLFHLSQAVGWDWLVWVISGRKETNNSQP